MYTCTGRWTTQKNASNAIYRMSRGINIPPTKHGRGKYTNILKREK